MTFANIPIVCTNCDYHVLKTVRKVTLVYQLPGDENFSTSRDIGWCKSCAAVRDIERDFAQYFDEEERLTTLSKTKKSTTSKLLKLFSLINTHSDDADLNQLKLGLKIARARMSSPKCLTCGASGPGHVTALKDYTHTCGGRLIEASPDSDAPQFRYAPINLYLDYEGANVGILNTSSRYNNLAKYLHIEAVLENGTYSGILLFSLFEENDFEKMLNDQEIFLKFANIIELRILHEDFDDPLIKLSHHRTELQKNSLDNAPRVLLTRTHEPLSKWLRSQVRS